MNSPVQGFNGERADPLNNTVPLGNGYRAYNPRLMRFHCPDGWSPFGTGGINTYAYCLGDPINRADPSGHHSLGGWLGIGLGAVLGLLLTPVSGGSSLAVSLSVVSVTTAIVSAGLAVAQQFVEESDPNTATALGWAAMGTGIVSGLSSAALLRVVPGAQSLVSLLKGTSNRPLGGLMMSAPALGGSDVATAGGQFRNARFIGLYPEPRVTPGNLLAFSFQDSFQGGTRLTIFGQPAITNSGYFAVGSGELLPDGYSQEMIGFRKLSHIISDAVAACPDINAVRLAVPYAGNTLGRRTGSFTSRLRMFLKNTYQIRIPLSGPVESFELTGPVRDELNNLQNSLWVNNNQLVDDYGICFTPHRAQQIFDQLSA